MRNDIGLLLDDAMFTSIDQAPGDWEPLVSDPESYWLAKEAMEDELGSTWDEMAAAFENYLVPDVEGEQASEDDLADLFM